MQYNPMKKSKSSISNQNSIVSKESISNEVLMTQNGALCEEILNQKSIQKSIPEEYLSLISNKKRKLFIEQVNIEDSPEKKKLKKIGLKRPRSQLWSSNQTERQCNSLKRFKDMQGNTQMVPSNHEAPADIEPKISHMKRKKEEELTPPKYKKAKINRVPSDPPVGGDTVDFEHKPYELPDSSRKQAETVGSSEWLYAKTDNYLRDYMNTTELVASFQDSAAQKWSVSPHTGSILPFFDLRKANTPVAIYDVYGNALSKLTDGVGVLSLS